jgi:hypothetical protein
LYTNALEVFILYRWGAFIIQFINKCYPNVKTL